MMQTFFLTGLPRSRTAWLANFLTYEQSFCFHEAAMLCENKVSNLPVLFASRGKDHVGNSCSSIHLFAEEYGALFPNAKYVLVDRRAEEVIEECNRIFGIDTQAVILRGMKSMERLCRIVKPLVVAYEDLDREDVAQAIWEHCISTIPFDVIRWRMLNDFNIQLTESGMDKRRALLCHG